ncbi:hypothetical protein F5880DRAFT_1509997 [Lentinula raphanica]|nr:hypothetical protein F5880DRAFT_1509997 [Lentinula raphanica]
MKRNQQRHVICYSQPKKVNFKAVLDQDTNDMTPNTFYPSQLTTFCTTFALGAVSSGEAYQLYQALAFLQHSFACLIRGHLSKAEIHRRLLAFTGLPNFSYSLQYYQLFWHGHCNCPLVAPLLVILICEFCEEHLMATEYADRVYNSRLRDGPGMSLKTRDRLLEDITELFDLQALAIPLPFDPSTQEGQLLLTVVSTGSRVDQIVHPVTNTILRPDPAFAVGAVSSQATTTSSKTRLRPPSPDFDIPTSQNPSSLPARKTSRKQPAFSSVINPAVIEVDDEEEDTSSDRFKSPDKPSVLSLRQSIARVAKAKPQLPGELLQVTTLPSSSKRERSPLAIHSEPTIPEPPAKKRRTQRPAPKWKLSDEMKKFGAFINSTDTAFSLQGLSRYNYLASRPLQSSTSATLPSPEALHSPTNCLSCLSRGVVCEGGTKIGGPCGHCDRTHRNCPSCLGLDEHRDRFLAIHNTVQGYPAGYSDSLERFCATLDEMGHVTASFETIFGDVRQCLALNLQEIRAHSFDFNVVLSKWADENPNLPLDYDLLTWLATFFGWDSACNLSAFLVDPTDTARLEEFLLANDFPDDAPTNSSVPAPSMASATDLPPDSRAPLTSSSSVPPGPVLSSRCHPAAAVPGNFSSDSKFHTPPASTTADDDMEVEEGTSRASVAQALVTEHDDSEEDEMAGDDTDEEVLVEAEPPSTLKSPRSHK